MGRYINPVPIIIHQDWSRLTDIINEYIDLADQESEQMTSIQYWSPGFKICTFGEKLTLRHVRERGCCGCYAIQGGSVLTEELPWLNDMIEDLAELKVSDIMFNKIEGDGVPHIDLGVGPVAVNHFFMPDKTSLTRIWDDHYEESYWHHAGSTWILNSQVIHSIENVGDRYWFNFRLNAEFDVVKKWFEKIDYLQYPK